MIESRTHGVLLCFLNQNTAFNTPEGLNEVTIGIVAGKHLILTSRGHSRSDLAGVLTLDLGLYDTLTLDTCLNKR